MNKNIARRVLLAFYLPTLILILLFPKQTFGNIYFVIAYLLACLVFLYLIFIRKK